MILSKWQAEMVSARPCHSPTYSILCFCSHNQNIEAFIKHSLERKKKAKEHKSGASIIVYLKMKKLAASVIYILKGGTLMN